MRWRVSAAGDACAAYTAASTLARVIKGRPPRLERVFQSYDSPLYFVTFATLHRREIQSLEIAHESLRRYAERGLAEHNVAVGRYVLMPDHVHMFVRGDSNFELAKWIGGLKRATRVSLKARAPGVLWQPGFFDHLLRSDESYSAKWNYVRQNPVRHGLVKSAEEWPHQGEFVVIDQA